MAARLHPDRRREDILDAATHLARNGNYQTITREKIAKRVKCSEALISIYYTMPELKRAVMRAAVKNSDAALIGQGIAVKDPLTRSITPAVRAAAVASFN